MNMSASDCLKLFVFLSEGRRRRLKSPKISQGVCEGGTKEASSDRKSCLRAWSVGAYTIVTASFWGEARQEIVEVWEKLPVFEVRRVNWEEEKAERMPPAEPVAGKVWVRSRCFGRNFF